MYFRTIGLPATFKSRASRLPAKLRPFVYTAAAPQPPLSPYIHPSPEDNGEAQMNTLTSQVIVAHYSKSIGVSIGQNRISCTAGIKHLNLIIKLDFAYRTIPLKT